MSELRSATRASKTKPTSKIANKDAVIIVEVPLGTPHAGVLVFALRHSLHRLGPNPGQLPWEDEGVGPVEVCGPPVGEGPAFRVGHNQDLTDSPLVTQLPLEDLREVGGCGPVDGFGLG